MAQSPEAVRGLIMVPMSLKPELSVQECDDWYNNEHVPIRMRLPYFETGYRYRSIENGINGPSESELPEWLAIYDISHMLKLNTEGYQRLLMPNVQSSREGQIIQKVIASRKYYDLISTYEALDFVTLEDSIRQSDYTRSQGEMLIIVSVRLVNDSSEAEQEWDRWYEEDHLPPLREVPGWRRTRRYRTSVIEDAPTRSTSGGSVIEYLTINEFSEGAAIGGPVHQTAIKTESRTNVVASKSRHSYRLHYIQGSASRDIAALQRTDSTSFVSPDGLTRTLSGPNPHIESFIFAQDNMVLPYRLEGFVGKSLPMIVLCTSTNLSWNIWDGLIKELLSRHSRNQCQILRLSLPIRARDVDHALSHFQIAKSNDDDLEVCSKALMIGKTSFLISLGVGGLTMSWLKERAIRCTRTHNDPELDSKFEKVFRGAIHIMCSSQSNLSETMDTLKTAAANSSDLADLNQRILQRLK